MPSSAVPIPRSPLLRPLFPPPSHHGADTLPTNRHSQITFRHPGYPDATNIILILFANDSARGGIHHETARIACSILAGCVEWDGFFSETPTGPAIETAVDGLLLKSDYYFRKLAGDANAKYPVVPSFGDWKFPRSLPQSWESILPAQSSDHYSRQSDLNTTLLVRDISCRITNHIEGTESAHLIPQGEEQWYSLNSMRQYSSTPSATITTDAANAILLRADLHHIFDRKRFVIVPKQGAWAVHVLEPGPSRQLADLHHNVRVQPLQEVAPQFLLARFAWAVFQYMNAFLQQMVPRTLVIMNKETAAYEEQSIAGPALRQYWTLPRNKSQSRSQSPKKRTRQDPEEDEDLSLETFSEEEFRGRSKRRRYSYTPPSTSTSTSILSYGADVSTAEEDEEGTYNEEDSNPVILKSLPISSHRPLE